MTQNLKQGDLFPSSGVEPDLGVNPESPLHLDRLGPAQLSVGHASAVASLIATAAS
jgi:hypothetical protein